MNHASAWTKLWTVLRMRDCWYLISVRYHWRCSKSRCTSLPWIATQITYECCCWSHSLPKQHHLMSWGHLEVVRWVVWIATMLMLSIIKLSLLLRAWLTTKLIELSHFKSDLIWACLCWCCVWDHHIHVCYKAWICCCCCFSWKYLWTLQTTFMSYTYSVEKSRKHDLRGWACSSGCAEDWEHSMEIWTLESFRAHEQSQVQVLVNWINT